MAFNVFKDSLFWFLFLNCAEKEVSMFEIQKRWKITSNYLYHKHKKLSKPLFEYMYEKGYLEKRDSKFISNFNWVKDYISTYYKGTILEEYSSLIVEYCVKYREILFSFDNLSKLFGKDEEKWKTYGKKIFEIIFFVLIYKDIEKFVKEHRALIVLDLFKIFLYSLSFEINFLEYLNSVKDKILEPKIISIKSDIEKFLSKITQLS